jgi:hypothetical protein
VTGDEIREAAADLARRTTAAQGLPERVTDQATLDRIAGLVAAARSTAARFATNARPIRPEPGSDDPTGEASHRP